jgi:thiol:disulfide interchange protein
MEERLMAHIPSPPPPTSPPPAPTQNGFGWIALVAGLGGLTLFWLPYVYPMVGIGAIALGAVGYSKTQTGSATNKKVAMLGIVLGVLSLVLPAVAIVGLGMYVALHSS